MSFQNKTSRAIIPSLYRRKPGSWIGWYRRCGPIQRTASRVPHWPFLHVQLVYRSSFARWLYRIHPGQVDDAFQLCLQRKSRQYVPLTQSLQHEYEELFDCLPNSVPIPPRISLESFGSLETFSRSVNDFQRDVQR